MLATFGYDFDLWGWPVWLLASFGGVLALLLSGWSWLKPRWSTILRLAAPGAMLVGLFFTRWLGSYTSPFFFYKFYYAQLDIAFLVTYGFGCGFAVEALRSNERLLRMFGIAYCLMFLAIFPFILVYIRGMRDNLYA